MTFCSFSVFFILIIIPVTMVLICDYVPHQSKDEVICLQIVEIALVSRGLGMRREMHPGSFSLPVMLKMQFPGCEPDENCLTLLLLPHFSHRM